MLAHRIANRISFPKYSGSENFTPIPCLAQFVSLMKSIQLLESRYIVNEKYNALEQCIKKQNVA